MTDLVARLRETCHSISDPRPGDAGITDVWASNVAQFRSLLLTKDPRRFLTWPSVRHALVVGGMPRTTEMLPGDWATAVRDTAFAPYDHNTLVEYAGHLAWYEGCTDTKVSEADAVLEFGGGFGSLALLIHRRGFRGEYFIYDLPVMNALQRYYLASNSLTSVICSSDLNRLDTWLTSSDHSRSLFIALWSLSETLPDFRTQFLRIVDDFGHYFIAYQEQIWNLDNVPYFEDWKRSLSDVEWHEDRKGGQRSRRLCGKRGSACQK